MALRGVRVLEMSGLAPVPYCGQVLRDYGAEVIRVDRAGAKFNIDRQTRGKKSIALNMKSSAGQGILRKLATGSDVILDPFRPGVMERLNCGPNELLDANTALIYARLSGFGQTGPMSAAPGHDINYIAQTGVLDALRDERGKPQPPVNLVADFAGGGLLLSNGILAALFERTKTGKGQVLDLAMSEGASYAAGFFWAMGDRLFPSSPGTNMLDGAAHFYQCYETKDHRWMAVGAIEPQFYAALINGLGIDADLGDQMDQSRWSQMKETFSVCFREKTMAEWTEVFRDTEACCSPVLTAAEAALDAHNSARGAFLNDDDGVTFPAPVPIFSRTQRDVPTRHSEPGDETRQLLAELDIPPHEIDQLFKSGAVS